MKNVPNIISTKDLSYLEDILNWNFVLIKKVNNYISNVENEEVKKVLDKSYKELLSNYDKVLACLE